MLFLYIQIAYQGKCGYGHYSDFAVDDIKVKAGACAQVRENRYQGKSDLIR